MAYKAPGVTLTEIRGGAQADISPIHRNTVLVGRISETVLIENEAVVRSSTGLFDNLEFGIDGITEVIVVESKVGLNDYVITTDYIQTSTGIEWTGTGNLPEDSDTYYVTYRKNRTASEYLFFESRSVDELYLKAGYPESHKENVSIYGQIAYDTFGISNIFIQPVQPPYAVGQYNTAIDNLKNRDLQTVIALTADPDVRKKLSLHVKERSLAESKRERICWTGVPELTDLESMFTIAAVASNETTVMVSPTRATLSFFDITANEQKIQKIDGAGVAALAGLYRDSFDDPSFRLLRQILPGFALYEEDYETYFDDDAVDAFGQAGIMQIVPFRNDFTNPIIVDELTTDDTNFKTSSIAIITAKHYNTKTIREELDDNFIGRKIRNTSAYGTAVKNFLISLFSLLVKAGSMSSFNPDDIQVSVGQSFDKSEINPSKVFISYKYFGIFIHKQVEGTYSILP
jgi:hypothetical protein